jgi:hypothetical protein
LKIKGHEILDIWFDGLEAGPIFQSLSDSCDRRLQVGLEREKRKREILLVKTVHEQYGTGLTKEFMTYHHEYCINSGIANLRYD